MLHSNVQCLLVCPGRLLDPAGGLVKFAQVVVACGQVLLITGGFWVVAGQLLKDGQGLAVLLFRLLPLLLAAPEVRQGVVGRLTRAGSAAVAQRDLDEARVQLSEAQTHLETAKSAVRLWQDALEQIEYEFAGTVQRPRSDPTST